VTQQLGVIHCVYVCVEAKEGVASENQEMLIGLRVFFCVLWSPALLLLTLNT